MNAITRVPLNGYRTSNPVGCCPTIQRRQASSSLLRYELWSAALALAIAGTGCGGGGSDDAQQAQEAPHPPVSDSTTATRSTREVLEGVRTDPAAQGVEHLEIE